jgi:hypothetical protein
MILERQNVMPFLERNPAACMKLMEILCARIRRSDERMSAFGQKIEAVEGIGSCAAIGMIQQCIADNYTCKYSRSLR